MITISKGVLFKAVNFAITLSVTGTISDYKVQTSYCAS